MRAIEDALLWLDGSPARFWGFASLIFLGALAAALLPGDRKGLHAAGSHVLFGLLIVASLSALHWPVWLYPRDLNPDEAQTIAGAITLSERPVYWKYVDGTTHGPWCELFLLLAHASGAPLNYTTARVVAMLLQAGSLIALWRALRCFMPERLARVGVLPGLAFWSFVTWDDFVHYSTELPGIFFYAVTLWTAARALTRPAEKTATGMLALSGFCLGAIPFAKLQMVPLGLAAAALVLVALWQTRSSATGSIRVGIRAAVFVAGGLATTVGVAIYVSIYGLWGHFWPSYILSARDYLVESHHPSHQMPMYFLHFSATEPAFAWFFWGGLVFAALYLRAASPSAALSGGLRASGLLLIVALFCVLRPAREVTHYLHILVLPMTSLAAFALAIGRLEASRDSASRRTAVPVFLCFLAVALGPQIYQRAISGHRFASQVSTYRATPVAPVVQFLREQTRATDSIAIWGWEPHLLVSIGRAHGTREAHTAAQLMEWPLRPYYVDRYLWDLERNRPQWFVDVVGPGSFAFEDRARQAHETIPRLKAYIAQSYEPLAEFEHYRIYRRKDSPTAAHKLLLPSPSKFSDFSAL